MKLKLMAIVLLAVMPGLGHALGLGNIQTRSALNEPFEARVELISATRDELDSLNINLADLEAFQRAGIERSHILTQLRFGLKETETGPDYIRIYSSEPIREPFLNFLLEVSWSKGRIYRQYTVLLDPPIYAPIEKRQQTIHPKAPSLDSIDEDHVVVYDPAYEPEVQPSAPVISSAPARPIDYSGGDYGPTVTGDTLWSLARAMRPDSSVSIQQMMFALLRANPEAFINGNINGLKRGEILRMPSQSEMESLSKEEAFEQTKIQNNSWDPQRFPLTEAVPMRPDTAAEEVTAVAPAEEVVEEAPVTEVPTEVEVTEPVIEDEPELRLVAPDEGAGDETTTDAAMGDADSEALAGELALATESIEALKLENADLGEKLSEAEGLITDLQRYIELKENELNLLQEQVRIAAVEEEKAAMPAEEIAEAAEEELAEEEITEEDVVEEEVAEEEIVEEETTTEVAPEPASMVDTILGQVMGFVEIAKNNIMVVAGAMAALVLIIFGALFSMRRRGRAEVVDIPTADEYPDFEDVSSEDETDIGPAMADAEAVTELPESAPEPDFDIGGTAEDDKTQVVAPAAEPAEEEEEEDPMAEVNVFLAYEHFDQAEEFVRQAIEKEPDNIDYHSKLLEVFYAAGNKKSYEEAAKALHDKVGGQGDHWEMAVAMWQELSPNRELFAEPTADEAAEEQTLSSSGGIVDITGDEEQTSEAEEEILDVTAAMNLDEEEIEEQTPEAEEEVLDVTAAMNLDEESIEEAVEDEGGLDFTPESEAETLTGTDDVVDSDEEVLDITSSSEEESAESQLGEEEDILDVTAAVGLDEEPEEVLEEVSDAKDAGLDFSFGEEAAEESPSSEDALEASDSSDDVLDLTMDASEAEVEAPAAEDDALSASDSGDDILDLTANSTESDQVAEELLDEDVLDVSKSSAEDLLDVTTSADFEPEAAEEDLLDVTSTVASKKSDDGVTVGGSALLDSEEEAESDSGASEVGGDDVLDLTAATEETESSGDDLTFDVGLDVSSPPTGEIPREGLDLDLQVDAEGESDSGDIALDMDNTVEIPESALKDVNIEEPESGDTSSEGDVDMDSTVQAPSLSLSMDEEADEEGGDETVLVKRSSETTEQSAEDEIGTQLDLAKAYIELGDNDNAKTILDEVIALGNDEQKQQAQELLGQI